MTINFINAINFINQPVETAYYFCALLWQNVTLYLLPFLMRILLFATVVLLLLGGFSCPKKTPAPSLEDNPWHLKQLIKNSTTELVPADITITANFKAGNLNGKGGCNTYNATYTLAGNRVSFGPVMSTKLYCPANNWEIRYFDVIRGEMTWQISGNTLTLQGIETTLVYEKP